MKAVRSCRSKQRTRSKGGPSQNCCICKELDEIWIISKMKKKLKKGFKNDTEKRSLSIR